MTPQALELMTAVGPPDCAMTALPWSVFMKIQSTGDNVRKKADSLFLLDFGPCPSYLSEGDDAQAVAVRQGNGVLFIDDDGLAGLDGQHLPAGAMQRFDGVT